MRKIIRFLSTVRRKVWEIFAAVIFVMLVIMILANPFTPAIYIERIYSSEGGSRSEYPKYDISDQLTTELRDMRWLLKNSRGKDPNSNSGASGLVIPTPNTSGS